MRNAFVVIKHLDGQNPDSIHAFSEIHYIQLDFRISHIALPEPYSYSLCPVSEKISNTL